MTDFILETLSKTDLGTILCTGAMFLYWNKSLNGKFSKIDERFSKIDQRFAKIDERFAKIDQRFAKMMEKGEKYD